MKTERASLQAFWGASALLFAASTAGTIAWCASMSGGMPMPGGWTMSMAWMRMSGQTWPGFAASFLGMWVLMMVAMKLPSLVPMLWQYRQEYGQEYGQADSHGDEPQPQRQGGGTEPDLHERCVDEDHLEHHQCAGHQPCHPVGEQPG